MTEPRDITPGSAAEHGTATISSSGRSVIAVIGIDGYHHWRRLANAVRDARGAAALFDQLGFAQVTEPLIDDRATGRAIQSLVTDELGTLGPEDSLVVFYAGHGGTRKHRVGDRVIKTGYLIPVDAHDKVASWIDLEGWLRAMSLLPARHILVVLDACHSGIALDPILKWRDRASWQDVPLETLRARRSRRIITSALDDQIAHDSGPVHGHSLFTGCLIEGLTHGIRPGSQVTTGSELGVYLQQRVDSYPDCRQTPDFGTFAFDERGEMVIPLLVGRREARRGGSPAIVELASSVRPGLVAGPAPAGATAMAPQPAPIGTVESPWPRAPETHAAGSHEQDAAPTATARPEPPPAPPRVVQGTAVIAAPTASPRVRRSVPRQAPAPPPEAAAAFTPEPGRVPTTRPAPDQPQAPAVTWPEPAPQRPLEPGSRSRVGRRIVLATTGVALAVTLVGALGYFAQGTSQVPVSRDAGVGGSDAPPDAVVIDATVDVTRSGQPDARLPQTSEPAGSSGDCPPGMVAVPGGRFWMGSPAGKGDEEEHPAHEVTLSAYCIDRTEVTVKAYAACVEAGRCIAAMRTVTLSWYTAEDVKRWSRLCNGDDRPDHPINCVDWNQAKAYCTWAGGRLPSEAEWEYAARGKDGRTYPWGNEAPSANRLNACGSECVAMGKRASMYSASDGWETTAPVGRFPDGASPFGALDMAGNVWEWTEDCYGPYKAAAAMNPRGAATGAVRVMRGGAWDTADAADVRAASRNGLLPSDPFNYVGFRCARGD